MLIPASMAADAARQNTSLVAESDFLPVLDSLNQSHGTCFNTDPTFSVDSAWGKCRRRLHFLLTKQDGQRSLQRCCDYLDFRGRGVSTADELFLELQRMTTRPSTSLTSSTSFNSRASSDATSAATSFATDAAAASFRPPASSRTSFSTSDRSAPPPPVFPSLAPGPDLHPALVKTFGTSASNAPLPAPSNATARPPHYHLKYLPSAGFFCSDIPPVYHCLPLRVRYEFQRLTSNCGIALPLINPASDPKWDDYDWVWQKTLSLIDKNPNKPAFQKPDRNNWDRARDFEWPPELNMTGVLEVQSERSSSLFRLGLNPVSYNEKSNRFFRKFGSHRWLRLLVPEPGDILARGSRYDVEEKLQEWLNAPGKSLLGCQWVAFFNKAAKATQKQRKKSTVDARCEVIFFAESGPGLEKITRDQVLSWFIPTELNPSMTICKLYARLELGFSTTLPTVVFNPSQIREVGDSLGDGALEDSSLNDQKFDWNPIQYPAKPRVMNDGCSTLSYAAAKRIWTVFIKESGPVPSAFQARIGPWKGVWFVESVPQTEIFDESDIWINVTTSQRKFDRHAEDYGTCFEPLRLTFEVLEWSRKLSTSKLYIDHLPILEDRGVDRNLFEDLVLQSLKQEGDDADKVFKHSMDCLEWLHKKYPPGSDAYEGTEWSGSHRKTPVEMARTMISSGFSVQKCERLIELMRVVMQRHFQALGDTLNVPIDRSTLAIGVADPFGCLGPNEIFVGFSDSDIAEAPFLHKCDALVSRHPSLRASDVQRVHVVFREELMHLRDVVVFPRTGVFPLAGKLQGGDYDGDRFWVCWDQKFVQPFSNAAPPAYGLVPEEFGIKVDRTNCGEVFGQPQGTNEFFRRSFRFQWQDSLLGQVTNSYEQFRYTLAPEPMGNKFLSKVADIHDLIIDAAKNGYTFTESAWKDQRRRWCVPTARDPLYKEPGRYNPDDSTHWACNDIVDHLMFKVVRPRCKKYVQDIGKTASTLFEGRDEGVERLYYYVRGKYSDDAAITAALHELESSIKLSAQPLWRAYCHAIAAVKDFSRDDQKGRGRTQNIYSTWNQKEQDLVDWYNTLASAHLSCPRLQPWLDRHGLEGLTTWDLVKASALYCFWPHKKTVLFMMAGREICELKSQSCKRTESVIALVLSCYKFKNRKRRNISDEDDDEDESFGTECLALDPPNKPAKTDAINDAIYCTVSGTPPWQTNEAPGSSQAPSRPHKLHKTTQANDKSRFTTTPGPPGDGEPPDYEEVPTEYETDDEIEVELDSNYASAEEDVVVTGKQKLDEQEVDSLSQGYSQLDLSN